MYIQYLPDQYVTSTPRSSTYWSSLLDLSVHVRIHTYAVQTLLTKMLEKTVRSTLLICRSAIGSVMSRTNFLTICARDPLHGVTNSRSSHLTTVAGGLLILLHVRYKKTSTANTPV